MLMELKSLAAVQKKPTTETSNQITHLLNYSTTHTAEITEYTRRGMILHIHSGAYYISELEAQSRVGGYFLLGPK